MINNNNRQNRRRGRGNQRSGPQGRPDNRNRGNAAQLLEKYKGLARDAQMQGDRVQAEYYLQFADHYFRVLEEINASKDDRQPSQHGKGQRQRSNRDDDQDQDQDRDQDERENDRDDEPREDEKPKRARKPREPKADKPERADKPRKRNDGDGERGEAKPRRTRRKADASDAIAADVLPPSIAGGEADAA